MSYGALKKHLKAEAKIRQAKSRLARIERRKQRKADKKKVEV